MVCLMAYLFLGYNISCLLLCGMLNDCEHETKKNSEINHMRIIKLVHHIAVDYIDFYNTVAMTTVICIIYTSKMTEHCM